MLSVLAQQVEQAGLGFVYVLGAAALTFLVSKLSGRGQGKTIKPDDTPTTTSTRGAAIPLVIGRQRVGAVFMWAGDRKVKKIKTEVGKGTSNDVVTGHKYEESGQHALCVGPANRLLGIWDGDGQIYNPVIDDPVNDDGLDSMWHPSGLEVDTPADGPFRMYWGAYDQSVDSYLNAQQSNSTNWPGINYVAWQRKKNGGSPQWGDLQYDIEVACDGSFISGSSAILSAIEQGVTVRGVNPAHALHQLMTAQYPHGAGVPLDWVDELSLEAMGLVMVSEHMPINMQGEDAAQMIESIYTDMGYAFSQVDGRMAFLPVREESGTLPTITEDLLESLVEIENSSGSEERVSRIIYEFNDESRGYRNTDIIVDNTALLDATGSVGEIRSRLETITHPYVAQRAALRRSQADLRDKQSISFTVKRAGASVNPGDAVILENVGVIRITAVKHLPDGMAQISALLDSYGVVAQAGDGEVDTPVSAGVASDLYVTAFDVNASDKDSSDPRIAVLRIRGDQGTAGANIWFSVNGGAYTQVGTLSQPSAGGVLETGMTSSFVGDGSGGSDLTDIKFEPVNDDIQDVLDLQADQSAYTNGRQLLIIGGEVMHLEHVEAYTESAWAASTAYSEGDFVEPTTANGYRYKCLTDSGNSDSTEPTWPTTVGATVTDGDLTWECRRIAYQLWNIERGKKNTTAAIHYPGDIVFIVDANDLPLFGSTEVTAEAIVDVKSQAFSYGSVVSLTDSPGFGVVVGQPNILLDAAGTDLLLIGGTDLILVDGPAN